MAIKNKMRHMKRQLLTLTMAIITATTLFSQIKEVRETEPFTSITASSGIDVYLTQGDETKVEVEANKNSLHRIITEVKDETLHIYVNGKFKWSSKDTKKVYVTAPAFKKINASGGADIRSTGSIHEENLKVISSGGADVYLTSQSQFIKLICSGGADISIKGNTDTLDAVCSGGSDIDANKLIAKYADVNASGGSDIEVNVSEELKANASGGGDVNYTGSPKSKKINESGGGDVTRF